MSETGLSPLKRALRAIDELQAKLDAAEQRHREPIAVIGIGCRLPGGSDTPEEFWQALRQGVDAIREVPPDRWDVDAIFDPDPDAPGKSYTRWGGFLSRVDGFDPLLFGVSPREAVDMDPQQRLLLEVGWEALEHAGQAPDRLEGSKTGVFLGICSGDYARLTPWSDEGARIGAYSASGIAHSVASGRLAYVLGLRGPAVSIDTACSSSLVAIHLACQSLRAAECRMTLAGGVHLMLAPDNTIAFCKTRMMSPEGRCKTFGATADGFVLGEGCGILVLKRLSDAQQDGDRILAVIRGTAANQDGASGGLTVPSGPAQEAVVRDALADANLDPADVTYVEAHGTGTSLGDPIEVRALAAALGPGRSADSPLLLGSVKTNVGHLEAAAGVTGVIKAVLSVQAGEIPAHLHAETLSPHIPWQDLPIDVVRTGRPWPVGRPRVAGVSSFGFSGTNAHVLVEAAPVAAEPSIPKDRPVHVVTLSARTDSALRALADRHAAAVAAGAGRAADVAHSLNAGRAHLGHRRAWLARDEAEIERGLRAIADGGEPEAGQSGDLSGTDEPRVVFLFTGQGSQYAGMGRELYETQPTFRRVLDRCDAALRPHLPESLLDVLFEGSARGSLDRTAWTQPALFALELALAELWQSWGVRPAAVVGHSVGEIVAATVAGVLSPDDGLELVATRGRLMQALAEPGTMAAVFADEARVRAAIAHRRDVSLAAINAPGSVVISGATAGVAAVREALASTGVSSKPLVVSHAFHSPLMNPMLGELEHVAGRFKTAAPRIPLVSNLSGEAFAAGQAPDAAYWARHARQPVRFADSMAGLLRRGHRVFLEIGPKPTLSGLGRQTATDASAIWLPSLREGHGDWHTMLTSLAALYVRGARVDWRGFDRDYPRRIVSLPRYPFERTRYWVERPAASATRRTRGAHPLLGVRLESPALTSTVFDSEIAPTEPAFVGEHRVFDMVVMPATGLIEMAMAAAPEGMAVELGDFVIHEALMLAEGERRRVQVVLESETAPEAGRTFRIHARQPGEQGAWRVHASGRLARRAPTPPTTEPLHVVKARCARSRDVTAFYEGFREMGLGFGERFHGIAELFDTTGEALGRIVAPRPVEAEAGAYGFHPAWLDACVQVVGAALDSEDRTAAMYMPIGIDAVRVWSRPHGPVWSHAVVRRTGGPEAGTATASVTVFADDGSLVATLEGLALKRASRAALALTAGRQRGDLTTWVYEPAWELAPPPPAAGRSPVERLDLDAAVVSSASGADALARRHGFAAFPDVEPALDAAIAGLIVEALEQRGWVWQPGTTVPAEGLASRLGIHPKFVRLLDVYLDLLVRQQLVARDQDEWRILRRPASAPASLAACEAIALAHPALAAEVATVLRCGPYLADVLAGTRDPLSLLFPEGSVDAAEALYRRSGASQLFNGLVASLVGEAVHAAGPSRVRVLEIGGGTGGTTAHLVPVLPWDRVEYTFTDISPAFTARAQREFGQRGAFHAQALDIEKDPATQGLGGRLFDVIVCANVLHATRDLAHTLSHVRSLLATGGLLVLVEVLRPMSWIDVTFGLTDGWWRFDDATLRPSYPLISTSAWDRLLTRSGFEHTAIVPGPDLAAKYGEAVIAARAARREAETTTVAPATADRWLVFADTGGVGDRLANALAAEGGAVTVAHAGEAFRARDDGTFQLDPTRAEDFATLIDRSADGSRWKGVVFCWGLDAALHGASAALSASAERTCGAALLLSRALAARPATSQGLWIVTRGAQRVTSDHTPVDALQALLWGFARTLALEHPELRCVRVDLSPEVIDGEAAALVAELGCDGTEDQIAYRPAGRFVARLARHQHEDPADRAGAPPRGAYELSIGARGVLDNLAWRTIERDDPAEGEVQIEAEATALNFRDVLNAMGLYPGTPPFGSECAGRVTAIGRGVTSVQPGDRVLAAGPGGFRRFVTVRAGMVRAQPAHLTAVEAVTVPIAFITAAFALEDVAGLRPGERVLIHAAAGGVGLAAVQVAQAAGAEVFATAGSPAKRAHLRSMGVAHVMDSRSLAFGDEIRAATAGAGVDVVLNSLTGGAIEESFRVMGAAGRFVELGKRDVWTDERVSALRPDVRYHVVDWGATADRNPGVIEAAFDRVMTGLAAGRFRPLPYRLFRADRVVDAFRHMAQGRHLGKVVVVHERDRGSQPASALVRADGTYLVTGAFGGLGLRSAAWLVGLGARHLVLIGRREPDADARAAIHEMEGSGARVDAQVLDVGDEARLRELVDAVSRSGPPVRGVIHSAGVLADGIIDQLAWEQFLTVLRPKMQGAWALHQATRRCPLDFFVLYSSMASVFGSPGQANHSAANAFLDALAAERQALGLPGVSLNWGVWSDIGAGARQGVGGRVAEQGIGEIAPDEGLQLLDRFIAATTPQLAIVPIDWPRFLDRSALAKGPFVSRFAGAHAAQTSLPSLSTPPTTTWRSELDALPPGSRRALLEQRVTEQASRVLGLTSHVMDVRRPLQELGLDSLMAVELRNALAQALSQPLPSTLLFDHPTVAALVDFLSPLVQASPREAPPEETLAPAPLADVVSQVEEMSDEEVERLFAERTGRGR